MHHRKLQLLEGSAGGAGGGGSGCGTSSPGLMLNVKLPELDKSLSTSDTLVSSPFRRPSQMLVIYIYIRYVCVCVCTDGQSVDRFEFVFGFFARVIAREQKQKKKKNIVFLHADFDDSTAFFDFLICFFSPSSYYQIFFF